MTKAISKRFFLTSLFSSLGTAAIARAPERSLRPMPRPGTGAIAAGSRAAPPAPKVASAATLIREAQLGGEVGYAVADAKSGLMLESGNARLGLPPASVTKAVTALFALDRLGPEHRFYTELRVEGGVTNGILRGNLVLKGGGDPTLDTNRLAALAADLKKAGIREVRGKFIVDGTALPFVREIDKGQPDHVGYNPSISGLMLNYNRVHFEWKRAGGKWAVTMDARSERYRPEVSFAKMRVAARELPVYTYAEKRGQDHWTVAQGALGKGGSRWLPVRQPEIYAGEVFATFARSHGINLPQPQKGRSSGGKAIARQSSADLQRLCRDFLRYSNNLMAEAIGLAASGQGSLRASANEMSRFAAQKLGMANSKFVDHSGLGDASSATAQDMTLAMVKARGLIRPILKPFAMRDAKRRVMKNHPVKVVAKTGTLNFVSGLSGYAVGPDGTEMAFAIFAADERARGKIKRGDRERPQGGRSWNRRAKALQQKLIERWAALYAS